MDSGGSGSRGTSPLGYNICTDPVIDPVITTCGHMYCWAHLYRSLHGDRTRGCQVCRTHLSLNINIISFYSMQDLPIPEQRRNHANDLTSAMAIPPCPTAPTIHSGQELIQENRAQNPQVGVAERVHIMEQYFQDTINGIWNHLQLSENERPRDAEALNRLQMERDALRREIEQLRTAMSDVGELIQALGRQIMAMAAAPRRI